MAHAALAQERVFALRETIARLEGRPLPEQAAAEAGLLAEQLAGQLAEQLADLEDGGVAARRRAGEARLATGVEAFDQALDGGLPLDAITEIRSLGFRHAGAASGLALALAALLQATEEKRAREPAPFLWIGDRMGGGEAGLPYAPGLKAFGLDIRRFFQALPQRLEDALWLAEAALQSGLFAATLLEVRGNPPAFGLTESRRLSLRAKAAGRPLLLLRQAGEEEASSAAFRLLAEPAPALARRLPDGSMLGGSIGHPVFRLTLEKSRNPAPLSLFLEWNPHDRRFLALDPARQAQAFEPKAAHSGAALSAPSDRPDPAPALGAVLAFERAFERAS
ncbi:hypothetical protein [Rhizobium sp. CSW-27]|uniref:ImuA family protein n=1 Tax=Rhizobium sp. CSW-27 TaxID=2839985 RepID=UPI00207865E8|nr:hypothetical protein [Rhizobium sp. CSW-27]